MFFQKQIFLEHEHNKKQRQIDGSFIYFPMDVNQQKG